MLRALAPNTEAACRQCAPVKQYWLATDYDPEAQLSVRSMANAEKLR
jgi:predicted ATPase